MNLVVAMSNRITGISILFHYMFTFILFNLDIRHFFLFSKKIISLDVFSDSGDKIYVGKYYTVSQKGEIR